MLINSQWPNVHYRGISFVNSGLGGSSVFEIKRSVGQKSKYCQKITINTEVYSKIHIVVKNKMLVKVKKKTNRNNGQYSSKSELPLGRNSKQLPIKSSWGIGCEIL